MKDYAVSALSYQKTVRIYAATTTQMVNEAYKIHQTFPTASAALGRFLTASGLMSLMNDETDQLTLRIEGDGPIGSMLVEAQNGRVKGDIKNPHVYLKYEEGPKAGKLNVGAAIGNGYLHVTKKLVGSTDFFTSSSRLTTGEIGDDFTFYFAKSEQTPASVGLGVLVNPNHSIGAAGGYILQIMPGCSDDTITQLEEKLKHITSITQLLQEGKTPYDIINLLSDGTEEILAESPIEYLCDCSKETFAKALSLINNETLETLISEDHGADITCHFCKKNYHFSEDDLKEIIVHKKVASLDET